ncbi:hypothetical protein OROGR_025132 [Orobanche gracilis]
MEVSDKYKRMIEDLSVDDDDEESENFFEAFVCCICRDLLYKPVVLEEERDIGCFSPQISGPAYEPQTEKTTIKPSDASRPCFSEAEPSINPCLVTEGETLYTTQAVQTGLVHTETDLKNLLDPRKDIVAATNVTTAAERKSNQIHSNGTRKQVSVDDVLCGSCKRMLFRPIVLNCGHAFCTCCIVLQTNEMLKCEVCQSLHPGDIPKACLEFDHFLEEHFPKEYELRRDAQQMKQGQLSSMYPIIGDRYRCKDCLEQIGYDLCKDCHTTSSKLPGRFNQQHTSDHKFEIMNSNVMHNIMLRILRGQLQEVSAVSDALNDGSEDAIPSSDDINEDVENFVDAPPPLSGTAPNQRESERSD